jgi:hypothetical protein
MVVTIQLPTASSLLLWSNRLYITGSLFTLASAAMILYEKHSKNHGQMLEWRLRTEIVVIVAAFLSFSGSIAAISFGNIVSHLKDVDLEAYKTSAGLKIALANTYAATANQKAQEAREAAAKVEQENALLGGSVAKNAEIARNAEADLAKANKETSDFAHSLQQQQGVMAEQAKVSPQLTSYQIQALSRVLKPYAGQDVALHTTDETVVRRLAAEIHTAFIDAGITTKNYSTDMDALYQGVSVAVHDPNNVPPIANALVMALRQDGIDVHPVAAPNIVSAGQVGIFLGPN